jgi:hypothetical protein
MAGRIVKSRLPSADLGHRVAVIGSALIAAVSVALDLWQRDGGRGDLLALLDQAFDTLADETRQLR